MKLARTHILVSVDMERSQGTALEVIRRLQVEITRHSQSEEI